ncbi:repeat element 24 [Diadegma semiclausum ichnovirus]|nr:repeat element 24 [Diadegma semiclausum ichnovirus]
MSTRLFARKIDATLYILYYNDVYKNGKPLSKEYNWDRWRKKEERVIVNIDYWLPVFGGVRSPRMDEQFTSVCKLTNFVRMHIHLNACTGGRYASCSCYPQADEPYGAPTTFATPLVYACEFQHFHHYCWQHVSHWLMYFSNTALMPSEDNEFF